MWSFGTDPRQARVAGEFFVNAINVMRGAESVSSYRPIDDAEKFRVEYWELEERKLRTPARRLDRSPAASRSSPARASGIGRAIAERLVAEGACVVVADLDARRRREGRRRPRRRSARSRRSSTCRDEAAVDAAFADAALRFGGVDLVVNNAGFARSAALVDTDRRRLGPAARRARAGFVPRQPRRGPA